MDFNNIIKKIPEDEKYHPIIIYVKREGFTAITKDGRILTPNEVNKL